MGENAFWKGSYALGAFLKSFYRGTNDVAGIGVSLILAIGLLNAGQIGLGRLMLLVAGIQATGYMLAITEILIDEKKRKKLAERPVSKEGEEVSDSEIEDVEVFEK